MAEETATVRAWHAAVDRGDVEGLLALSSDDVEVGGPRGSGRGAQLLREWLDRAGIRLEPRRVFHQGMTVVVEQDATWHTPDGDASAAPQGVASVFTVRDGHVTSVIRHPDLATALAAAGLAEVNLVDAGPRNANRTEGAGHEPVERAQPAGDRQL